MDDQEHSRRPCTPPRDPVPPAATQDAVSSRTRSGGAQRVVDWFGTVEESLRHAERTKQEKGARGCYSWQKANKAPFTKPATLRNIPIVQVIIPHDGEGEDLIIKLEETYKAEMTFPGHLDSTIWTLPSTAFGTFCTALLEQIARGRNNRQAHSILQECKPRGVAEPEGMENQPRASQVRRAPSRSEGNAANFAQDIIEAVAKLKQKHTQCGNPRHNWCWVREDGAHAPLNGPMISSWANAILNPDDPHSSWDQAPNLSIFDAQPRQVSSSPRASVSTDARSTVGHLMEVVSSPTPFRSERTPHWFTVTEQEDERILRTPSRGRRMTLDEFCVAYDITPSVKSVLVGQEIAEPHDLSDFSNKLYSKHVDEEGLGLTLGGSKNLWAAIKAWKAGYDCIAQAQATEDGHESRAM
ncbi:hypothetical protein QFC20_006690 [Naganishia adeliensis]|uniref:Uncharacterized protein n=1 Tax=Naganishia adeliensis TaxID=92952 RepID=A0ACC2V781_9TREE|nr:hypothetical protein QFC20_006690 [Naganishia adeliensis]